MTLRTPRGFRFWSTVRSHGWYALKPFHADPDARSLRVIVRLSPSRLVTATVTEPRPGLLDVRPSRALRPHEERRVEATVRSCLRLDE